MEISNELSRKLDNYCKLLEENAIKRYPTCVYNHHKYKWHIMKKYIKIIQCDYSSYDNERSVWCFVDEDGNLYKAEGWTKPCKDVRGHIDNPIIDGYGFYRRF